MIPKTLIYCFGMIEDFGGKPWGLGHYVCLRSAVERIRPDEVLFFYEHEPTGPWWEITRSLVAPVVISAPREICGNPVDRPAHRADIVRLEKLMDTGGIYLDSDVFVHRDFDDLLGYPMVLGAEGQGQSAAVANAVILAERNAPFLRRWYREYRTFRGSVRGHRNEHSVLVPSALARAHPGEVKILSHRAFFWPLWTAAHIELIFNTTRTIVSPETYATHLWEEKCWRYIGGLTPGDVRQNDTNFHRWARPFLDGLADDFGMDETHATWKSRRPGPLALLSQRPCNAVEMIRAQRAVQRLSRRLMSSTERQRPETMGRTRRRA